MVYYKLESIWTQSVQEFAGIVDAVVHASQKTTKGPSKSPLILIRICGLFCESVSIRIMRLLLVGCSMNWKGFGGKRL
jgi:hypothetical protein